MKELVTDPRLAPIVCAVIDAAFAGESPGEGELLELVDPQVHRQIHDALFAGEYRDIEDPVQALHGHLFGCQRDELRRARSELADRITRAIERGEQQQALALSRERTVVNQRLAELERQPPSHLSSSASVRP